MVVVENVTRLSERRTQTTSETFPDDALALIRSAIETVPASVFNGSTKHTATTVGSYGFRLIGQCVQTAEYGATLLRSLLQFDVFLMAFHRVEDDRDRADEHGSTADHGEQLDEHRDAVSVRCMADAEEDGGARWQGGCDSVCPPPCRLDTGVAAPSVEGAGVAPLAIRSGSLCEGMGPLGALSS